MKGKIIIVIILLCSVLSMGCIDKKYTEEEKEEIRELFALEMAVLIFDMPIEPSLSGFNYDFIDSPTFEDCGNWVLDAKNHLKNAKEYRKIIFVDMGNKYDEKKYDDYIITFKEYIIEVEGYKDKANVYEEIFIMWDKGKELNNNDNYLLYDYEKGKITKKELRVGVYKSSIKKRKIWVNIKNIIVENENGYFNKSNETLEFIKDCDDIIEAINETIDIVSE